MKASWGWGVGIGFGLFVLAIMVMVAIAMTKEVDLVSEQYYDAGLHYQDHIKALQRAGAMGERVRIDTETGGLTLRFPRGADPMTASGRVTLYRPSSKAKDFSVPLAPDSTGAQHIPADRLDRGLWRVQVSWKSGNAEYYAEQAVLIP